MPRGITPSGPTPAILWLRFVTYATVSPSNVMVQSSCVRRAQQETLMRHIRLQCHASSRRHHETGVTHYAGLEAT